MKAIEFVTILQSCKASNAWLTFGMFAGAFGFYICFAIPVGVMTTRDYMRDADVTGQHVRRVWIGIRDGWGDINQELPPITVARTWLECIEPHNYLTDEQRLSN